MLNIQYEFAKLLQDKLDENELGIIFDVYFNDTKTNVDIATDVPIPDTYSTEKKLYIPTIIHSFEAEFAELENMQSAEYVSNVSLLIPSDVNTTTNEEILEYVRNVVQVLNKISRDTRAHRFILGDAQYILPRSYRLNIDTESANVERVDLTVTFTDNSVGEILDVFGRVIRKNGKHVTFVGVDAFEYELEKTYILSVVKDGSTLTLLKDDVQVSQSFVTLNDEIELGGVLMKVEELDLRSEVTSLYNVSNFISPASSSIMTISTANTDIVALWGSEGVITLNFTLPTRVSNQVTLGEYNYQEFEFNTYGSYNDKAFVGQDVKYFLNGVRIFPIMRSEAYLGEPDFARFLGSDEGNRAVIEQTGVSREYALYYIPDQEVIDLLDQITNEVTDGNTMYELTIIYPLLKRQKKHVISNGAISITNSTPIGISFSLEVADEVVLNQ